MLTRLSSTLIAVSLCIAGQCQITFEHDDLAVPGDVIERYVDTIPLFDAGGSGADQVWDFSAAITDEVFITTVTTLVATPYSSSFAGSNLAMTNDAVNYIYFNSTPASLVTTGAAGDFLDDGQNLVVPFNPSLLNHQFPRSFGDHFSDDYALAVEADGAAFSVNRVRLRHRGVVRDTTDAYGQITTPIGTYNALRVKTTDTSTDSIWIKLLSFTPWTFLQVTESNTTSYSWLAKETKLAVAEMTFDSLGVPARFTYTSIPPAISTGMVAIGETGVELYPSPAQDAFTIRLNGSRDFDHVEVFASDGRAMATVALGKRSTHTFDSSDWAPGVHLLRFWPSGEGAPLVMRVAVQR